LEFKIDGQYERLLTTVGVDDESAPIASIVFRALGDGKVLFESSAMRLSDEPKIVDVPLAGIKTLTLECDDAGDLDVSDHGDWADARLIKAASIH
jgi:hypothetical protein